MPNKDEVFNKNDEQAPADKQDNPLYHNDVPITSWLRNGRADTKPSFDKGNAWRKGRGITDGS